MTTPTDDRVDGGTATARVAFARLVYDTSALPLAEVDLLRDSLVAGSMVMRHRRQWRIGQWRESDGIIYGRIGFESSATPTDVWNDDLKDFEEHSYPAGLTPPFAIRLSDFLIAFQLRSGKIRRRSFTGALQALLHETSSRFWSVQSVWREIEFADWRREVSRVTSMTFRLEEPNPGYGDRHLVQPLIEGTNAEMVRLILEADKEDLRGLNVDSDFVTQSVEHARRYGGFSAKGEREVHGVTEEVTWRDGVGEEGEAVVSANPETGEATTDGLKAELTERPSRVDPERQLTDETE